MLLPRLRSATLVAFALVGLAGCRRRSTETSTTSTTVRAPDPTPTTTASAKAPVVLPSTGAMLCTDRFGYDGHLWSPTGITKLPLSKFSVTSDGEIAELEDDLHTAKLTSRSHPELPVVELPTRGNVQAWMSATGDVLYVSSYPKLDVQVWRKGAWSTLTPPADLSPASIYGVIERDDAFWFVQSSVFHETSSGFEKVDGFGVVPGKSGLELLAHDDDYLHPNLTIAPLKGMTAGAPRSVGSLITTLATGRVLVRDRDWAFYANGGVYGTVHASLDGKVSEVSRKSQGLVALDGHGRLFHQTQEGFVVRSPDGSTKIYPKASDPMFQLDGALCTPLGKGFETLPDSGEAKMGTLTVKVSGAHDVPVAVCPKLPGLTRCENSPERIEGRLDGMGTWSTRAPIGDYEATIQLHEEWLVADLNSGHGGGWHCKLEAGKSCTIELRAPSR